MTDTTTSISSVLTNPINAVFMQTFLRRAQQVCPYFVGTQPGQLNKQQGTSTVKWRRIEQLAYSTSALSEITSGSIFAGRSSVTPTFTDVLATVSKYGQFYILTEELDLYAPNGNANELVGTLGESAGRSLNQLMGVVSTGSLTFAFANGVASTGAVIAKVATGDLNYVVNKLAGQSTRTFTGITSGAYEQGTVPILPSFWGICHPDVAADIAGLTGFTSVEKYAQQVQIMMGEFGYYSLAGYGIRFIQTPDAPIAAGAGAANTTNRNNGSNINVYSTPIYGQDCLGSVGLGMRHTDGIYKAGENTGGWELINHPLGSAGAADPFNEMQTLAYKLFFAGAVLNTNWGLSLKSGAGILT